MTPEQEKQALEAYKNECERLRRLRLPLPLWEHWIVPYELGREARGRASGQHVQGGSFVEKVILDVAELADRNSPEDFPEGMIVTADELRVILERHLDEIVSGQQGVEGCKLVPVQPTDEMLSAAHCVTTEWYNRHGLVFPPHSKIYKAMLAASPQITSPAEPMQKAWSEMTHLEREEFNRRAAQPSDSVQGWQPIETAPKDGCLVLITDGTFTEVAKNFGSGWISSDGLDFGYGAWDDRLTHWMPLPEPPGGT